MKYKQKIRFSLKIYFSLLILIFTIGLNAQSNQHVNVLGTDLYMIIDELYYINVPQVDYNFPEIDAQMQYIDLKAGDERTAFLAILKSTSLTSDSISLNKSKYLAFSLKPKDTDGIVKAILIEQGDKLGVLTIMYNNSSKKSIEDMLQSLIVNSDKPRSDFYEFTMKNVEGFSYIDNIGSIITSAKNGSAEMGNPSILMSIATIQSPEVLDKLERINTQSGMKMERYQELNREVIFFESAQIDENVFFGEFLLIEKQLCISGAYFYNTDQELIDIKSAIKSINKK